MRIKNRQLRLFFILDETFHYQPNFFARFIESTSDQVVGVGIVNKIPRRNNINLYMILHLFYLHPSEIARLIIKTIKHFVKSKFKKTRTGENYYSVLSVCKHYNLNCFSIKNSINQKKYIDNIRKLNPDVIISSNSLYFGETILNIPNLCCINRHSALLPSYGGLWPVFQALRYGDKFVGVSIHTMEKRIDKGIVLSQINIKIEHNDTVANLYEKCFEQSVNALIIALNKIRNDIYTPVYNDYKPSYYTFPDKEDWIEFRKLKCRFI
jgi:methionyl-tRNA formyltransferase